MLFTMISRSSSYLGQVGPKSRSQGQILKKSCRHSRGHIYHLIFIKICQHVILNNFQVKFKFWSIGFKNQVTRSNIRKTFVHCGDHNFHLIQIKIGQHVIHNDFQAEFDFGSSGFKNQDKNMGGTRVLLTHIQLTQCIPLFDFTHITYLC